MVSLARHRVHRAISRMLLGNAHNDVNKIMDAPYKMLGKKHRILFHDPLSVLALFPNDRERQSAALLHIAVDKACENRFVEKMLEALTEAR